MPQFLSRTLRSLGLAMPVLLTACGGGGGDDGSPPPAASCNVPDRQAWVRSYFLDDYLWYALSPSPSPAGYADVDSYFDALLYRGGDLIPNGGGARWPSDRYSGFQSTASFNRFFGAGQTLGFGLAVNGLEARVPPIQTRLFIRYVEPGSPAALTGALPGGLLRGDEILSINGTPAATVIANDDFSGLSAAAQGDALQLSVRRGAGAATAVTLSAAVFALTPVQTFQNGQIGPGPSGQIVQSPNGRRIGYVFVKDMIDQVSSPLAAAMSSLRNQGMQDLVLDLRYNGGGRVAIGATVASHAAGNRGAGQVYASLLYNAQNSSRNQDFLFSNPGAWAGLGTVYVLAGERTCSASEQVVNGLRGVGVNVVLIGDTTCGKPVGFNPTDDGCGTTYSVVTFESVNAQNQGRYFDGLTPTCAVAEDFSRPIGDLADPLLVAAANFIDTGSCPVALTRETPQARSGTGRARYDGADGGERTGMSAR